ncbi:aquaporin [Tomitella biformata]|uniref:aquaporin n=1 Tax=Tomitella biformata TaxID=630403 RepID=UPI000464707A|nr:aquaporin [Tomitella biformata]
MEPRKIFAEMLGTGLLVFIGVGVATLSFGFGFAEASTSAGVVATALAFGFIMLIMAYAIGPLSGAHINPAVTMGFLVSGRMSAKDALMYWGSQIVGGIIGAGVLRAIFAGATAYNSGTGPDATGLGTNGWGDNSMIGINVWGALAIEIVLTFIFVAVVLAVTTKVASTAISGLAIGIALATVHLMGIPMTGTSVNPARSLGPALFAGGDSLSQLWLFIVAPLVGGALAALVVRYLYPNAPEENDLKVREPSEPA